MAHIINVRGTNGSGKTTLLRGLIQDDGDAVDVLIEPSETPGHYLPGRDILIVGAYKPGVASGGMDGVHSTEEALAAVWAGAAGDFHAVGDAAGGDAPTAVLFEGILISTVYETWLNASRAAQALGHTWTWAYMGTSLAQSIENVKARRLAAGRPLTGFKTELVVGKFASILRTAEKAIRDGERVVYFSPGEAAQQLEGLINGTAGKGERGTPPDGTLPERGEEAPAEVARHEEGTASRADDLHASGGGAVTHASDDASRQETSGSARPGDATALAEAPVPQREGPDEGATEAVESGSQSGSVRRDDGRRSSVLTTQDGTRLAEEPPRADEVAVVPPVLAAPVSVQPRLKPNISPLAAWVNERHAVFLRRASFEKRTYGADIDPEGWTRGGYEPLEERFFTEDPILRAFRFCNVFRELDRVTTWIRENIRQPFADHPHLWFMLCVARTINWPDTLAELISDDRNEQGYPSPWPRYDWFRPEFMTAALDARRARGEKVYTGAYMIRAESDPKAPWYSWTKQRYVAEIVLGRLWEDRSVLHPFITGEGATTQDAWGALQRYTGWGPFMAYQAVGDMIHTRLLEGAPDRESWAAIGPGSKRGLNRLLGVTPDEPMSQDRALDAMRLLVATQDVWRKPHVPPISIQDMQNCLCETDKYLRVKNGEGRPRALFVAGRGY